MGAVIYLEQALETITCWARDGCGIQFAVPRQFYQSLKENGATFYCPRGHHLSIGKSDLDKLREELEKERTRTEWEKQARYRALERLETANRSAASYKGKLNHVKAHVGNGLCPCCKRSFQNLRRHMASKHPDFGAGET